MEEQLKKEMVIVEENPLIKGNGNSVLYLTDEGLYCKTYFICEKLEIKTRDQSLFNELESNNEYELYMLPGKKYKLILKKENLASEETIKDGSYSLQRPFVMATKGSVSSQSELVQTWFNFVKSDAGKKVIKGVGLILPE